MKKPYKGFIRILFKQTLTENVKELANREYGPNKGYFYRVQFIGHPEFGTTGLLSDSHTSLVVKEYHRNGDHWVETLNSRYKVEKY